MAGAERRQFGRRQTYLRAWISVPGRPKLPCIVQNLSVGGALLEIKAPTWLPFVRVESVAKSAARATELGGRMVLAPSPDFLDGRVAVVADPTGATIGLLEWTDRPEKGSP